MAAEGFVSGSSVAACGDSKNTLGHSHLQIYRRNESTFLDLDSAVKSSIYALCNITAQGNDVLRNIRVVDGAATC